MNTYSPDSQRLFFDGLLNFREMGGMPLANGKVFRDKVFMRSDISSDLPENTMNQIIDYGVNLVIDLRCEAEKSREVDSFSRKEGVKYTSISLFDGDPDSPDDYIMSFLKKHTLGDYYIMILEEYKEQMANIFRLLLNNEGVTLFHCAVGKDRTGVIAAILYLLAGASYENIILNYKVSFEYGKKVLGEYYNHKIPELKHTALSEARNMTKFLNYIDSQYEGKIESYLLKIGITNEEISALREKCIEE